MVETTFHAFRRMALDEKEAKRVESANSEPVFIRLLPPRARFSLRFDSALLSTPARVMGLTLDMPINRYVFSARGTAMRLGPDEWLLSGPEGETAQIAADVGAALAGLHHSMVDISHRQVALSVSGPRAADVLNSGCPLDLSSSAFPAGCATRTLLGKADAVLAKTDDLPTFEIECGRSFAAYIGDLLLEAAGGFRVGP